MVHRPSPETRIGVEFWVLHESGGRQVKKPRSDNAAAPPHLRNIGEIQIETFGLWQRLTIGLFQNLESLRVSLHEAVLDAIVHHLDEVACAVRPRMDVTALCTRVA